MVSTAKKSTGLNYELLSELWDIVVRDALTPSERNAIYKWIQETADSKSGFPMSMEDLIKFFKEKMVPKEDYEKINSEGFDCLKGVFLLVNEKIGNLSKISTSEAMSPIRGHGPHNFDYYNNEKSSKEKDFGFIVNISPEELEGVQSIWDLTLTAASEEVAEKARNLINDLYFHINDDLREEIVKIRGQYLNKCLKSLQETLASKDKEDTTNFTPKCLRCISLISKILDESEKKGVGSLKSHSALIKGELLTFSVANEVSWGSEVPRKIDLRLHSNITIYELRIKVSKHFKVTWDEVKLVRSQQKEIKDNENGRTLGDLRIRNGEELTASKRPTNSTPQVELVDSNGSLNPTAKKIFIEWFNTYSENGKMDKEQCAAFINSCTNDCRGGDDYRVKDVFNNNDLDRDGILTLEDFLNFYMNSCKYRPQVVWSNFHAHSYRNDLRKATEIKEEKVDITELPRYILTTNTEYFQIFFSLLDFGSKIAIETWKLLNRLPTSHQVFSEIVRLKGIRESPTIEKDWSQVLDPSSGFKLLYALQVIEYLMEDELDMEALEDQNNPNIESTDQSSYLLWAKDPELMQYKKTWQADFIYYGGFDYLFKIFHNYSERDHKSLGIFDKNILSFILKILSNYLAATFAASVPNIYRCLSFIKLFHLNLDFIQVYMNKRFKKDREENSSPEQPQDQTKEPTEEEKMTADLKIEETQEFRTLVERLKGELGSHILQTIDFKEMIKVTSELGYDILTQTVELESEDRIILEYSLNILVSIFLYESNTIKYFLELGGSSQRNSDQFILEGIFCSRSFNVRNYFSHAIYVLVKESNQLDSTKLSTHYIRLFLKNIPSSTDTRKDDCNQYFEILCKLIEETYNKSTTIDEGTLNFEELIGLVVQRIKDHVSSEDRSNLHLVDKAFVGLLQLCEKIVAVKPELKDALGAPDQYNMIEEIFNQCLFDTRKAEEVKDLVCVKGNSSSRENPVKCKSSESREIAYKLLLTLCQGHQANLNLLFKQLQGLMGSIMKLNANQDWNYSPANDSKSLYGYVGIRNPRCICYMNAMLQQFFMTPTFRYGILAADDKKEPNVAKDQDGNIVDDNLLHQIQQMFGFLELSDRQDYSPHEFCFAFKDHSGQPVNISIQQDTQEFLNMIFDKLENLLKETPFKHILQGVYGGKTTNQTICHGCGTVREREDIFYNLSVEVKNMKNIYESFEKFITGETIEDYYCESCKKKNSITKRTCLSSLPNVLIVHLQRIIFDLDTLMNQKINSKLEFPFELNMKPYTKEHLAKKDKSKKKEVQKSQEKRASELEGEDHDDIEISNPQKNISESLEEESAKNSPTKTDNAPEINEHEKEYYEYKLVGVLVHDGTAEFGHYYSYINTNRGDLRGHGPGSSEKDKWLEFNDSMIRSFNTKNIENECFGGESSDANDDYWAWGKYEKDNSKNAYILVYERVTKDPLKLTVTSEEDESYLKRVLNVEEVQKESPEAIEVIKEEVEDSEGKKTAVTTYQCDYYSLKGFVPGSIYQVRV